MKPPTRSLGRLLWEFNCWGGRMIPKNIKTIIGMDSCNFKSSSIEVKSKMKS